MCPFIHSSPRKVQLKPQTLNPSTGLIYGATLKMWGISNGWALMQIPIPRLCEFSVLMAPSLQPLCEYTSIYEFIILWTQEELLPWTESHSPPPVLRTAKIKIFQKYKVLWSLFQYSINCWKLGVELSGASNMRNQSKGPKQRLLPSSSSSAVIVPQGPLSSLAH